MRIQLTSTVSPKIKFDGELCISARVSIISNIIEKNQKLAQLTPPSPKSGTNSQTTANTNQLVGMGVQWRTYILGP